MRIITAILILMLILALFACSSNESGEQISNPIVPIEDHYFDPAKASTISPGDLHNKILERLDYVHPLFEAGVYADVEDFVDDMVVAANEAFSYYNLYGSVTEADVWRGICICDSLCDAELMTRPSGVLDPYPTITDPEGVFSGMEQREILTHSDRVWFEGLYDTIMALNDPTPEDVEAAAIAYGYSAGWPIPGSAIGDGLDILLSSNQFWGANKSAAYEIGILWLDVLTGLVDGPIIGAIMSTIAIIMIDNPDS